MTLDEQNGNEFWSKAITTEMTKVKVAFELRELGEKPPLGYQFTKYI